MIQRTKSLAHACDSDGCGAPPDKPVGNQRIVANESERSLAQSRDKAVGKIEMSERTAEARKQKSAAHEGSPQGHEQARSETIEGQPDQR
jgi:hypothetical protein